MHGWPPPRAALRRPLFAAAWLFASAALATPAMAQDVEFSANPTRWRVSLEQANPDGPGEAVLVGLHYDLLELFREVPNVYLGFGGYGSVLGDRGGLYAAGASAGWRQALAERWWIDVGGFLGGGGADEGDWGGGLFVRPHLAFEYAIGSRLALRIELSHIQVPGGELSSTQLGIGLARFDEILTAGESIFDLDPLPRGTLVPSEDALVVGGLYLDPSSGSRRRDGSRLARRILLGQAGVELPLDDGWFVPIEVAGAGAGGAAGYAQGVSGIGRRGPWFPGTNRVMDWQWRVLAGAAGGGEVDTGGGLLIAAQAGFEGFLSRDWSVRLLGGYFVAPDGHFDGTSVGVAARWAPRAAALPEDFDRTRLQAEGVFARDYALDDWTVQLLHKSYFLPSDVVSKDGEPLEDDVHLVGAGVAKDVATWLTLSLRAFSAWDGEIGGYREGQIGLRHNLDVLRTVAAGDFYVQYHAGAAGGGGADVASGLIHEFSAGWRYRVRPSFDFGLEFGKLEADRGTFEGQSIAATFSWQLSRPLLR